MAKHQTIYLLPKGNYTQVILENTAGERFDITTFIRHIDARISGNLAQNTMSAEFTGEMLFVSELPEQKPAYDWSDGFPAAWKDGFSTGKLLEKDAMINCYDNEGWKLWREGRAFRQHCIKKWGEGDSARKDIDYLAGYRAEYSSYLEWVMTGATTAKVNPHSAGDRNKNWAMGSKEAIKDFPCRSEPLQAKQSPVFDEGYRTCYDWRVMEAAFTAGKGPKPNKPHNPYRNGEPAGLGIQWDNGWFHCLEYPSVAQAPKPRQR